MSVSRDRLPRNEEVIATYSSRLSRNTIFSLFVENEATLTPFRWRNTPMVPGPVRDLIECPRIRSFRPRSVGIENSLSRNRRIGRRNSVLPNWYPRKPLAEITYVVKALERRRMRLGETEGLQHESPILQDRTPHCPSIFTLDVHPEHDVSMITPYHPSIRTKRCPSTIGKVPKILLDIANKKGGDSEYLTPQKKLLNNIDVVEKVVMEELRKVKRSPRAKRAEREKRLKMLMFMR